MLNLNIEEKKARPQFSGAEKSDAVDEEQTRNSVNVFNQKYQLDDVT